MATPVAEAFPDAAQPIQVGIIGNTSAAPGGYPAVLGQMPGFAVIAPPHTDDLKKSLSELLACRPDPDFDCVVIEAPPPRDVTDGVTLESIVRATQATSPARILVLTLPSRRTLVDPDQQWRESVYRDVASRCGVPILDGAHLLRHLLGESALRAAPATWRQTKQCLDAVSLPAALALPLVWRGLRDPASATNALAVFGFLDDDRLGPPLHAVLGGLLAVFLNTGDTDPAAPTSTEVIDREAARSATAIAMIEAGVATLPTTCHDALISLLARPSGLTPADQARALLLVGQTSTLRDFAATGVNAHPEDSALRALAAILAPAVPLSPGAPAADSPVDVWLRAAQEKPAEAIALLDAARHHHPHDLRIVHDLARAHERQQDWATAEALWRHFLAQGSTPWWIHTALARAANAQGRRSDAIAILRAAAEELPDEPQLLAEIARMAGEDGHAAAAAEQWNEVIQRFPSSWIGYRGMVETLIAARRRDEAEDFIALHAPALADNQDALHDLARHFERRRDWRDAETAWRGFIARTPAPAPWAYGALAAALREQARYAAADDVLIEGMARFPDDPDLMKEAARIAALRGEAAKSERHWQEAARLNPKSPDAPLAQAAVLREQGHSDQADTVIQAAIQRLPDEPSLLEAFAMNAMAREEWAEALKRLKAAQRRFPASDALRQRIFEVRLRLADAGGTPADETADDAQTESRALLMNFESLGGGGHGCEFGLVQRECGAEPLGLLRWADLHQDALSAALDAEFAGVGDPEFTRIFVPPGSDEYWTTDSRYHMAMRSFIKAADVPLDRMRQQVTKRQRFLARKLTEDLRAGEKIFVFKNMKKNLTQAELDRLVAACHRYGDNTLLYVRYADGNHASGNVIAAAPGLLIGYMDHFSHTPDTDDYIGNTQDAWLSVCRRAYELWSATRPTQAAA